jgi:hypothetical protein
MNSFFECRIFHVQAGPFSIGASRLITTAGTGR